MAATLQEEAPRSGTVNGTDKALGPRRVLIVEDNSWAREQLTKLLGADPQLQVEATGDPQQAIDDLAEGNYSICVTDLRMPQFDGMDLIREVQQRNLPVTVIVTTGHGSIEEAVQAIRMGAYDFLTKPINIQALRLVVQRALRERLLQDEIAQLRAQLRDHSKCFNILSKNPRMHMVLELIKNIAPTPTTVLIEGETGTGKEVVARAIHENSRRSGPLVAVNCAALPETLLESELFGHEKGAFTSAVGQRRGRFELADTGTLFLDEVGDVPMTMQAKLLRVLQERRFERVGGSETMEVDVRIIAATNRSLLQLVKDGKFREDLYYRLNVVKIDLPPLRERPEDVLLLATHFTEKFAAPGQQPKRISPKAMEVLLRHNWPGNVRQLENAIERGCVTSQDSVIEVDNLPPDLVAPPSEPPPFQIDLSRPLPEVVRDLVSSLEKNYIAKALSQSRGNVGRCAKMCGVSRRSITAKIAEYQLDRAAFKDL